MDPTIASLTSRQAQLALTDFCNRLPDTVWKDGLKPNQGQIEATALDLASVAPPEVQQKLATLEQSDDEELKGEFAKITLDKFRESNDLREYVDAAINEAKQPKKIAPLVIVGGLALVLLVSRIHAESEIDPATGKKTWKFDYWGGENLDKLAKAADSLLPLLQKIGL